jgi:hypothetical protein
MGDWKDNLISGEKSDERGVKREERKTIIINLLMTKSWLNFLASKLSKINNYKTKI